MPNKRKSVPAPAGEASAARAPYDLYVQGRNYFQHFDEADNLDKAIESLTQAVELDPSNAAAFTLLGEACWRKYESTKQGKWVAESKKSCLRAVELNDRLAAVAHVNLAFVYAGTGRSEEALSEFRQSLALDPVNADCWRGLAAAYEAQGRYNEAEAFHKAATGPGTHSWKGHSHRGVFYYNRGRYSEAESQFAQIPQNQPIRAKLLGGLYLAMGRHSEAVQLLEQASADRPSPGVYNNLANAYLLAGRQQDAVGVAEKAIRSRPNDYRFKGTLAEIYHSLSDSRASAAYEEAIELAKQQLAVHPANGEVWGDLAVYQAKTHKKEDALANIEKAIELAPEDWAVTQSALIVYETTGKRPLALLALQAAADRGQAVGMIRSNPALKDLCKEPSCQQVLEAQPGVRRSAKARG
jgi:tetratricopeptide (TPR) repeat protein